MKSSHKGCARPSLRCRHDRHRAMPRSRQKREPLGRKRGLRKARAGGRGEKSEGRRRRPRREVARKEGRAKARRGGPRSERRLREICGCERAVFIILYFTAPTLVLGRGYTKYKVGDLRRVYMPLRDFVDIGPGCGEGGGRHHFGLWLPRAGSPPPIPPPSPGAWANDI